MTWDGYKKEPRYPPVWYSKLERQLPAAGLLLVVVLYLFLVFIHSLISGPEQMPVHERERINLEIQASIERHQTESRERHE